MATRSTSALKQGATPIAIVAGLAILVVLVGWIAYASFGPPKKAPMSPEAQGRHDWIVSLAKKYGTDINKLPAADRDKLQEMTHGYGAQALKGALSD